MHAPAPHRQSDDAPHEYALRTFDSQDQAAVSALYEIGMLAGQIAPNDTGADIENVHDAYLADPRHHFWVAFDQHQVVGMIGVASDDHDTAEIRRLRVRPDLQDSVLPEQLLESALNHCRRHGYLKVRLDTRFERCNALETFERIGFHHTRDRSVPGKEILEFYADLYRSPDDDKQTQELTPTSTLKPQTKPRSPKLHAAS